MVTDADQRDSLLDELEKCREKLRKYSRIEGTEIGETCHLMCDLSTYTDYVSETFLEALLTEMQGQLAFFEENFKIKEKKETYQKRFWVLEEK